jgi:hypothetical protein
VSVWKYLVLVGGIAGMLGFFLPFISNSSGKPTLIDHLSAYDVVSGADAMSDLVRTAEQAGLAGTDTKRMQQQLEVSRTAMMACYMPAALLALLGAIIGYRRRMGRIAGILAMLLGGINAAIWYLFYSVAQEDPDRALSLGIGMHLLLAAGIAGMLAGLGAMILPDRGE